MSFFSRFVSVTANTSRRIVLLNKNNSHHYNIRCSSSSSYPLLSTTATNNNIVNSLQRSYSTEVQKDDKPVDPKIMSIVDSVSQLNLLETASLVDALKKKLNITDIAMPVMAAGAASPAAAGGASAEAPPAQEEKPKEKTTFSVKLEKFDAAAKAKIIREVKALVPGMNLVEAKKFVEGAPKVIKDNVPKEEAEKMKKTLESLGATVKLE